MAQAGSFILDRGCSYREFLDIFRRSAENVFRRAEGINECENTLLTTFNISLENISEHASSLANLLSVLDSDEFDSGY